MTISPLSMPGENRTFPPFSLTRLLGTVFVPIEGCRVALLIDLDDPRDITDFRYLANDNYPIQRHAHEVFYQGLQQGGLEELGCTGGEMFAYRTTGGSNLDMPDQAFASDGTEISLEKDVYTAYDLVLCISTYSATAPLTAHARQHGFRGATMHGMNDTILASGLAVDYNQVSGEAELLRRGLTRADAFEIDFSFLGQSSTLRLITNRQEAQKSQGLCHGLEPDVANLPAGEVYYVPESAEGAFPMKYEDEEGTIGLMHVSGGRITSAEWLRGSAATVEAHNARMASDPVTGEIGELGMGTQELPFSHSDIQDEKVRGTVHVATGRSDHLGGDLTPDKFAEAGNATHDDILFHPDKTPEIEVIQVRMERDDETVVVMEHYRPAPYMVSLLTPSDPQD